MESGSVPPAASSEQPGDLSAESALQVARSFYVARMVRLSLMLVFAVAFTLATVVTSGPGWATVLFGLLTLVVLSLLWRTRQVWRRAQPTSSA